MNVLRIALGQVNPTVGDLEGNARLIRQAAADAAALEKCAGDLQNDLQSQARAAIDKGEVNLAANLLATMRDPRSARAQLTPRRSVCEQENRTHTFALRPGGFVDRSLRGLQFCCFRPDFSCSEQRNSRRNFTSRALLSNHDN